MSTSTDRRLPRKLRRCVNIADIRDQARRTLPGPIFDHVDGGADDEVTLAANFY